MFAQAQIGDDFWTEQADRVTRGRIAETREKFFGDRGAADHAAALEHMHFESRLGEITRADKAVVAAADDDGVSVDMGRHDRAIILPDGVYP